MTTSFPHPQTQLQQQTHLQQTPPPQPAAPLRLPPQIENAFRAQLLQAAVQSGKELAPQILDKIIEQVWAIAQHQPGVLKARLSGLFPPEQAQYWHEVLTQLQQQTELQSTPSPSSAPPSPAESDGPMPMIDFDLLNTVKWLQSLGVGDYATALDWAKYIHKQPTSRPLQPSEIAQIQAFLNAQNIEDYVESPTPPRRLEPPSLLASHSPFVHLVQVGVALVLLFVAYRSGVQMGQVRVQQAASAEILAAQQRADQEIQRAFDWAQCVKATGSEIGCLPLTP